MIHEKQNRILNFWFGGDPLKPLANVDVWFSKSEAVDEQIRITFEPLLDEARTGAFDDWVKTANGALALVILCDQFPRHIYRGSEEAFEYDDRALRTAQIAIDTGLDKKMTTVERCFLYLPFEHSEDLDVQTRSVELFMDLYREALDEEKSFIEEALRYAVRHRDIIQEFGRFPHRNDILGRPSTAEEKRFLKQPGSAF